VINERFEVITAVKIEFMVPGLLCRVVDWYPTTTLHAATTQRTNFEAFTVVMFQVEVFCIVTPCSVAVDRYHGITTQKTSN
jgi:hypothetical protein